MTLQQALGKLESLGDEKVRKQNRKNGADDNQFGVKHGDIRIIAKEIKKDHDLALLLWDTGNLDARLLAVLIMDPRKLSADDLDKLVQSTKYVQVADWMNAYIVKEHSEKEKLRLKWMSSNEPWSARAGWSLTSGKIARDADGLDLKGLLDRIEKELPTAAPEIQWTMNFALAYIGIHHADLRKRALAIGEKLGIYRDYPVSKGCTSPFAPIWINEMVKRQNK